MGDSGEMITVGPRKFKIVGSLGQGGFSIVKKGVDSETSKRVALKIMFVKCDQNDPTYKQTCAEIKMMRKLTYPSIIKLLGYDLHSEYQGKNCVILVQELAPHCELFDYLMHAQKSFSEQLVMYIMHSIFDAIDFMHSQGIAHRDLKPENILLDKDFNLKIADFGFATYFQRDEKRIALRTELGTRGYMAPEIEKTHRYGEKVDTFALGVIMFICAAGFPPFRKTNNSDWWFEKIMTEQWNLFWAAHERKAKFSNTCKNLIENMLAADPAKRFTVEQCQNHAFITANPAGKLMTKNTYHDEMKGRYSYVKAALKVAKAKKANDGADRELNDTLESDEVKREIGDILRQNAYVKADFLCQNEVRRDIAKANNLETVIDEIRKLVFLNKNISPEQQFKIMSSLKDSLKNRDLNEIKNAFSEADEPGQIVDFIPSGMHDDLEKIWMNLNLHKLAANELVVQNSVIDQYLEYDNLPLPVFDPANLDLNVNAYKVKFGFGTLIHEMKHFHNKVGAEVAVDLEAGIVRVTFPLEESMEMPDGETVNITSTIIVKMSMHDLPEGRKVLLFDLEGDDFYRNQFTLCKEQIFNNTQLVNLVFE